MSLPPVEVPTGAIRFNSDSQKLEYYDGSQWLQVNTFSPMLDGGARGLIGGGYATPASINVIEYITIESAGNSTDFGDLTGNYSFNASCSSNTRGIFAGSFPNANSIDYVTISSTGNAQDFGDLPTGLESLAGCSNSTRGIFAGGIGYFPAVAESTNIISYVTISSTGNAQDFGDLTVNLRNLGACASPIRGVFAGGQTFGAPANSNVIQHITISTTGNAQDFGDLTIARYELSGCSNSIRGLFGGGYTPLTNIIEYITISTLGNSTNFGECSISSRQRSACSSPVRGVFAGGRMEPATNYNVIEYVTISSQSNAIDFGDLLSSKWGLSACSNAHGGL